MGFGDGQAGAIAAASGGVMVSLSLIHAYLTFFPDSLKKRTAAALWVISCFIILSAFSLRFQSFVLFIAVFFCLLLGIFLTLVCRLLRWLQPQNRRMAVLALGTVNLFLIWIQTYGLIDAGVSGTYDNLLLKAWMVVVFICSFLFVSTFSPSITLKIRSSVKSRIET